MVQDDHSAYCNSCWWIEGLCRSGLQVLSSDDSFSYQPLPDTEARFPSWNGWSVGDRIVAQQFSPHLNHGSYKYYPFLIVDILKIANVGIRFLVAHILSKQAALAYVENDPALSRLNQFWHNRSSRHNRVRAMSSLEMWPSQGTYVVSNYFELMCDETKFFSWPHSYLPFLGRSWMFDTTLKLLKRVVIPAFSSTGKALKYSAAFSMFFELPRALRDRVYELALDAEFSSRHANEINVATLMRRRRQLANPDTQRRYDPYERGYSILTPALLWTSRQLAKEARETLGRIKTLVITVQEKNNISDWVSEGEKPVSLPKLPRIRVKIQFASSAVFLRQLEFLGDFLKDSAVQDLHIYTTLLKDTHYSSPCWWTFLESDGIAAETSRAYFQLMSRLTSILDVRKITWEKAQTEAERQQNAKKCIIPACGRCFQLYAEKAREGVSLDESSSDEQYYVLCTPCFENLEKQDKQRKQLRAGDVV
jgi:hypothetical protein